MANEFHENLKYFRGYNHMRQIDMANALGISPSTYSGYESGKREPNFYTLKHISLILNVSTDELLGLKDCSLDVSSYFDEHLSDDERHELRTFSEFLMYRRKK